LTPALASCTTEHTKHICYPFEERNNELGFYR
jgi:hypothetical protein